MTDALAATQFVWDALDSNKFVDFHAEWDRAALGINKFGLVESARPLCA